VSYDWNLKSEKSISFRYKHKNKPGKQFLLKCEPFEEKTLSVSFSQINGSSGKTIQLNVDDYVVQDISLYNQNPRQLFIYTEVLYNIKLLYYYFNLKRYYYYYFLYQVS
jgi:hypothetical protein